ncbi:MAG TPA: hypothetical protein VFA59_14055 [Vicinamibacterales bacterium]|nr:hypothetical protein [Vicinamibacterales bacterium]
MWHPTRAQWTIIVSVTLLLVLAWPPDRGRSLLLKITNWIVDPAGALPVLPPPLPMGADDDGDLVAAHDAQESDYYRVRDRSTWTRWRMEMKAASDPFDATTERQLLVGAAALSALAIWRLSRPAS